MDVKPLRARVGAVSPILFKNGEGCGACFKVRCLDKSICSRRAVTIIVTDECPGCASDGRTHFDLSGAAFGRMAVAGENGQLRNRGVLPVIYRRYVFCTVYNMDLVLCFNNGLCFVTFILSLFAYLFGNYLSNFFIIVFSLILTVWPASN